MSRPLRICLLGGSGLVGSAVIEACVGRSDVRLVAVARRELALPPGARMEVLLSDPAHWDDAIAAARPDTVVSALGTTIRRVGGDRAAFRAVDHHLVLACAGWAAEGGARQFIAISSTMADPHARSAYLRVKGETEQDLVRTAIARLDIIRPGLLLGKRQEWRPAEREHGAVSAVGHRVVHGGRAFLAPVRVTDEALAGIEALAPLAPLLLHGRARGFRPVQARTVADAILAIAHEKARGRFFHDYDGLLRALRRRAFERSVGVDAIVD